jgi:hypothetical protein
VARLAPARSHWHELDGTSAKLRAVDYEVYTMRTKGGARFADGCEVRGGGAGGLDLLLDWDGTPTVGEIKAPGDATMFLALVQALMYGVEISTPAQLRRLRTHYEASFGRVRDDARTGLALIYRESDTPRLLRRTKDLAQLLMADRSQPIPRHVAFIAFVRAELGDGDLVRLALDAMFEG